MVYYLAYHDARKWGVIQIDTTSERYKKLTPHSIEWYGIIYCDDLKFKTADDAWHYINKKYIINVWRR